MASRNSMASALVASQGRPGALSPLMQSAAQGFDVNHPYAAGLPRDPSVFTAGQFGPLTPILPKPLDEIDPATGRPDARRSQYPVAWNLNMGQPGSEGLKLASFATLRQLGEQFSTARTCIEYRVNEITKLKWDIVPTTSAELKMHGDEQLRADWQDRYRKIRDFFEHPDADRAKYPSFKSWLGALLEDVCTTDAVSVHLQAPKVRGRGVLGSSLASLNLVDGTTIRPMLSVSGATPKAPNVAYQQYLYGVPRVDLLSVITEADIKMMDEPIKQYRSDQMLYLRKKTRSFTPYGFSMVEQCLLPCAIGLSRQQWQWDYYQDGSVPAQWITAGPDVSTPTQVRQLQDGLNMMAGDIGAKHRIVVLPNGSVAKDQKPVDLASQFDEWITSTVTMAFGLTNLDIGIVPNVTQTPTSVNLKEMNAGVSDPKAIDRIADIAGWLKESLFDLIIREVLHQDDMQWSWGITEQGDSLDAKIAREKDMVSVGLSSVDESRIKLGSAPWGLPETGVPLWATASGPVLLQMLTSETGEQDVRPWQAPGNAKPTDAELSTPAHQSQGEPKPKPKPRPELKPVPNAGSPTPTAQATKAELGVLRRYLVKGRDPEAFISAVLPMVALRAAADARPDGAAAAVAAARSVMVEMGVIEADMLAGGQR